MVEQSAEPEKSDCAAVPVNQPNKGESIPTEVGEGRARTKENIGQSNTSPTQSGKRVSQGLSGVRRVHARLVALRLRGPVSVLFGPRRPGDLPVLVHVVSQRAWVLRLRRAD